MMCLFAEVIKFGTLNLFDNLAFFLKFEDKYPNSKFIAYAPSITEDLNTTI